MKGYEIVDWIVDNNLQMEDVIDEHRILWLVDSYILSEKFGVSRDAIRQWCKRGKLTSAKIGNTLYFDEGCAKPRSKLRIKSR